MHKLKLSPAGLTLDMAKVISVCRFQKFLGDHRILWAPGEDPQEPTGDRCNSNRSRETDGIYSDDIVDWGCATWSHNTPNYVAHRLV